MADPTPSAGSPISAKTRVSLTLPQMIAVQAVVIAGVLGWSRIDSRLGRIEDRLGIVENKQDRPQHSTPAIGAMLSAPKE